MKMIVQGWITNTIGEMNHDENDDMGNQGPLDQEVQSLDIATDGDVMMVILTMTTVVTKTTELRLIDTGRGRMRKEERTRAGRNTLTLIGKGNDTILVAIATKTSTRKDRDI